MTVRISIKILLPQWILSLHVWSAIPNTSYEGGALFPVDRHHSMMESKQREALIKSVRAQLQNENDTVQTERIEIQVTIWT